MVQLYSQFGQIMLCLMAAALSASCSLEAPDTGGAALELHWASSPERPGELRGVLSGVVDTIGATVSHEGRELRNEEFGYEALEGVIEDIPAGPGRDFLVQGLGAGEVLYEGRKDGVTIIKNDVVIVEVTMEQVYPDGEDVYPPKAVDDLDANVVDADVTLTWTAPGDDCLVGQASSYDIRYYHEAIDETNWIDAVPVPGGAPAPGFPESSEQLTISGLPDGRTHYLAMKAVDDANNWSGLSNVVEATISAGPDETPPAAITDLTIDTMTEVSVTLNWTAPGDDNRDPGTRASEYDIRYSDATIDAGNFDSAIQWPTPPAPQLAWSPESVTITGLTAGQQYWFAVRTADEVPNWSGISNVESATPADITPPAKTTDLHDVVVADTSVTLAWTAPGDDGNDGTAAYYDIRYLDAVMYNEDDFGYATQWPNPPTPQPAGMDEVVTITGLTTGKQYTAALKTYDDAGNPSPMSSVVAFKPGVTGDDVPPAGVTDLTATPFDETTIVLSWTAPGDDGWIGTVASYEIRRSDNTFITEDNFENFSVVTRIPSPSDPLSGTQTQTVDVMGLATGINYFFAFKAVDDAGNWSGISNNAWSETSDNIPPAAIGDLIVEAMGAASVTLRWSAPGDDGNLAGTASQYDIRYGNTPIDEVSFDSATQWMSPPTPLPRGSTERVTIDGLAEDTWYFAVKTADEVPNWSPISNVVSASFDATPPAAIGDLAVESVGVDSVTLTWTAPGDDDNLPGTASQYDIRYSDAAIDAGNFDLAIQWPTPPAPQPAGSAESVTIDGLTAGTTYYFAVKTADEVPNWSPISNSVSAAPDNTPPAAIADLAVESTGADSVTLAWIAPGDDGDIGTADSYDIRYSDAAIDAVNFDLAIQWPSPPTPQAAGSTEGVTIDGLAAETTYYFAVKTADEVPNWSPISNTASARTWTLPAALPNITGPAGFPRAAAEDVTDDIQVVWSESDGTDLEIFGNARVAGSWGASPVNLINTTEDSSLAEVVEEGGTYHLVWYEGGATTAILYQNGKYDTWSVLEAVAFETPPARPAVGVLATGTVVVAWSDASGAVRYNTRDPMGIWGVPADVLPPVTNAVNIAGTSDGSDFHLAFVNGTDLVYTWFDGATWNDGGSISTVASSPLVALAVDSLAAVHVLWWDASLYYSNWSGAWSAPETLPSSAIAPEALTLVTDADDGLHATFDDDSGGEYDAVHLSRPASGSWSAGDNVSATLAGDSRRPCLVVTPDRNVHVIWEYQGGLYISSGGD